MERDLTQSEYYQSFNGSFSGILRWHQLDELWKKVRADNNNDWYIYAVGEEPPKNVATSESVDTFLQEIDLLLRNDHGEDYCGIVYADNRESPAFIKIFDPNNLGSVCGSGGVKTLPAWILSKQQPINLPSTQPQTGSRKRWWKSLFK